MYLHRLHLLRYLFFSPVFDTSFLTRLVELVLRPIGVIRHLFPGGDVGVVVSVNVALDILGLYTEYEPKAMTTKDKTISAHDPGAAQKAGKTAE